MPKPFYGDESPIAALATPPGESALALIRCSGPGCVELLARVFSRPAKLRSAGGNRIVHGWIQPPGGGNPIDEVLVSVYRAPRTYTGEEGADISCHGGNATVRAVLEVLRNAGFRDGLPGEFSFRAFVNGKLDLTRSESVMELVKARTDEGRRRAIGRLSGRLGEEIAAIKAQLVEILAETELHLDYDETELSLPGERGEGAPPAVGLPLENLPGRERAEDALERLRTLAGTWGRERLYQEGALAVIAGRPNAGKSSLFNALLGEDRSIVTEIPGTTRDWIEATVSVGGIPLRLADTAGLRGAEGSGKSGKGGAEGVDPVEELGIQKSRELLDQADLVLYVIDGERGLQDGEEALFGTLAAPERPAPLILLWNKADIAPLGDVPLPGGAILLSLSARTGRGLAELCQAIAASLERGAGDPERGSGVLGAGISGEGAAGEVLSREGASLGNRRQKELVDRSRAALEEALELAEKGEALELIAPSLREAVDALGEITGEVSTADILETIFSKFCVGK